MDKATDSGSVDVGSIPVRDASKKKVSRVCDFGNLLFLPMNYQYDSYFVSSDNFPFSCLLYFQIHNAIIDINPQGPIGIELLRPTL